MEVGGGARAHSQGAVVEELAKFTFTCDMAHEHVICGKGFRVGRISPIIRPNMRFLSLFSMVFGLLAPAFLDA
jgi:hypothetical protein